MSQRLKGQEVTVIITRDGNLESELTDILSFNITLKSEVLSQGFLGEKFDRYDDIYKGCDFDLEMHTHSQDWIPFCKALLDRQQRKVPNLVFNIVATLNYPSGETPTVTLPDVKFGPVPINIGGRADYAKHKFEGSTSEADLQTS